MDLSRLIETLSDGEFHSGEELGEVQGVSRAAVWKQIKKFEELGLEVFKVTGKGYKLSSPISLLNADAIFDLLSVETQSWLTKLDVMLETDSTNQRALEIADSAKGRGYLCFAEYQSAGRGRRGRQWISPIGSNIYFSLVREFVNGAAALEGLSLVVGISIVRALENFGLTNLELKWPNDVVSNGSKAAGILLEMTGDPSGVCQVVIGVGINVFASKALERVDQAWTSLDKLSDQEFDRNIIAAEVTNQVIKNLNVFEKKGFAEFLAAWNEYDFLAGKEVSLSTVKEVVSGKVLGVEQSGGLLLEVDGKECCYKGGEVSVRLAS